MHFVPSGRNAPCRSLSASGRMSSDELEIASAFLTALAFAAQTGDREAVSPRLAEEIEWLTPTRDLHGIGEVREGLTWVRPPDNLEVEFADQRLDDLGGGRIATEVHEVYTLKGTGEFAFTRDRRIELAIRDRKVVRYEMRIVS